VNTSAIVFCQKQPQHEKKIYNSPEGKLYVQKSLSLYLQMSSVSENKKDSSVYLRNNDAPKPHPICFTAEGLNTIHHPWAVDRNTLLVKLPKQDVVFQIYADSRPPQTAINFDKIKPIKRNGKLYLNGNAEITFEAKDELSGVEKTLYSIDSAEYREYNSPFILDKEKTYVLKYYSFDHVGNDEQLKTLELTIDRSLPKTLLEIKGDHYEDVISGNAQIILTTTDKPSGIAHLIYQLDESPERNYLQPVKTSMLKQGDHKLVYYAIDNVGNKETQEVYNFYVDKTPPTILQEIVGKSFMINGKEFSSGHSQLKLTTLDNKAGVKAVYYSINDGEFKLYEKPVLLSAVNGKFAVKAYAIDNVNNRSQVSEDASTDKIPYIDLTGPSLDYSFTGPVFITSDTVYINHVTKVHLKAHDNESGVSMIQYKVDTVGLVTYDAPFSISQDGLHTIGYMGFDNVDNTNISSFKVTEDNAGPVIFPRFSTLPKGSSTENGENFTVYPIHVVLFIAATDFGSGYDHMTYTLNGSAEKPCLGSIKALPGKNKVTVKAYDKLGNETTTTIGFITQK
jgi:hypothetical protein